MSKTCKRYVFLAILFSLTTVAFCLLYHFKVISRMDLNLAVIYISYLVGIALLYNGAYHFEKTQTKTSWLNYFFGVLFVIVSVFLLIYGLVTGTIILF